MSLVMEQAEIITRSDAGIAAGVCSGIGERFDIDPWLIRLFLLLSVFIFGTGILFYLMLWIALPARANAYQAYEKRALGVCSRVARSTKIDVGIVRFLALAIGIASVGATVIGYVILHFVVPDAEENAKLTN